MPKHKSILDIAEDLKDKYKLPEIRENKCHFDPEHPPHKEMKKPHIKLDLEKHASTKRILTLLTYCLLLT